MNTIFSAVLDMSLTASWVILAILIIRFLLRKAPRKYSYALWSAAAFRLCCPVSFSSALSLFNLPLPAPIIRHSETAAQITHTPVPVIPTAPVTPISPTSPFLPQLPVTVPVIPPPAAPAVNTAGLWLTTATVIWCVGMAALLIYAAVSYVRLRRQLATAIRLDGNVYQAENIRSPFILGFLQPKIYIPYGLDADSLRYVLAHERMHLRRLDHMVKPLSFLLLTVHWFNPLVWLAFFLMSRDMEMSCDEAVLAREGNIRKSYSTTLLSFAANRRFPSPSPLAFGETGVRERIRNVLRWKKPATWVTVIALLVCSIALIACAADPEAPADSSTSDDDTPAQSTTPDAPSLPDPAPAPAEGSYLSAQCIYMSPYSSYSDTSDSGYHYKIADWTLRITHRASGEVTAISPGEWGWQEFPWTEEEWSALFLAAPIRSAPDISGYAEKLYLPLSDEYFLLQLDGTIWIVKVSPKRESVWSIYALKPTENDILWEYQPYLSSRYPAFGFTFDLPESFQIEAYSRNPSLMVRNESLGISSGRGDASFFSNRADTVLYWAPQNVVSGQPLYENDDIRLFIRTPDNQTLEATICIQKIDSDSTHPTYSATMIGSDLALTHPADSWYAVISPAKDISGMATQAAVQIFSNGKVTTPYFLLSHTTEYVDGQWISGEGQAITPKLLTELGSSLPNVLLDRDFRMDHQRSITYGPMDFMLYDAQGRYMEEYRYYYGLTFLNWLEQGEYYLTFRIAQNGDYIVADDRYESTGWTGIVRIVVADKLAQPLPMGAKLELASAEMRINGVATAIGDKAALKQLEKLVFRTKNLPGGAGCPFGSVLYLTCADGTVYSLCHAEDSCSVIFVDGAYYQYSGGSNDFWTPFDPGSPSAPRPDTSEDAQLRLIADSVEEWAVHFDYADDRVGYAVTDLDGNGRLEVIAAQQGGTGNYTYASFYEVNDTFTALEKLRYDIPEGDSQPDIMEDGAIPARWGVGGSNYIYIFRDYLRESFFRYYTSYHALTLRDGEVIVVPLAMCETQYAENGDVMEYYTDGYGNPISKEGFEQAPQNPQLFRQNMEFTAAIHWILFPRDNSILSLDADTLLAKLKESRDGFLITEIPN